MTASTAVLGAALGALALGLALAPSAASAQDSGERFTVAAAPIADEKAVFATIESVNMIPARARLDGTVTDLRVDEGDVVTAGQVIAVIVAGQLDPQIASAAARIAAVEAELAQARLDLQRTEVLAARDAAPRAQLDEARTRVAVLESQLSAAGQERGVLMERSREGDVQAPADGRVLRVPVVEGTVVRPGETIADIALDTRVLRLRLPERHARTIAVGDPIRLGGAALGGALSAQGEIVQVYPEIQNGRVVADARAEGLGDYFVGERVRVYLAVDEREAILVPRSFIRTRFGVDYALLAGAAGAAREVVVQMGPVRPAADIPDAVEILSGLGPGDVLIAP